jgi:hypothetical protein
MVEQLAKRNENDYDLMPRKILFFLSVLATAME